jgi:signal recognition particle receptor subunit beta
VVVANKQDLPGVMPEEEIRKMLTINKDVDVVKAVATEGKGVREAFKSLVDKISGSEIHVG